MVGATKISPSCSWPISATVRHTLALPSTTPGLPAKPVSWVTEIRVAGRIHLGPGFKGVVGDAPQDHGEGLLDYLGRGAHRRRGSPLTELVHDPLAPGDFRRPHLRAARLDASGPGGDHIPQGLLDLGPLEIPDILNFLDEPEVLENGRHLAHLVPEHRMEPMLHIEQMVLDIGEHGAGGTQQLFEAGLGLLVLQQSAVLASDAVTLLDDLVHGPLNWLARLDLVHVDAQGGQGDVRSSFQDLSWWYQPVPVEVQNQG